MTILHLSDTHGQHNALKSLPEADIIVHSGDFTLGGSEEEASDFIHWLSGLNYEHKIFIAGNHDMCLYGLERIERLPKNIHYLCNSEVVLDGFKFYGVPMFMEDCFDGNIKNLYQRIPNDTNVLITHQPPFGICDVADYGKGLMHRGSPDLAERIKQLHHLHCHLYGHEHDASGAEQHGRIMFSNSSLLSSTYELVAKPRLITL